MILSSQFATSSSRTYQSIFPKTRSSDNIETKNIPITSPWFNIVVQNIGSSYCSLNVATYLQNSIYGALDAGSSGFTGFTGDTYSLRKKILCV